jgi:hypothetical protein
MAEIDWENDFGFTLVDEDELNAVQGARTAAQSASSALNASKEDLAETDAKLEKLYNAIQPLLRNLAEDPEKEYVFWPDRVVKVQKFKDYLDEIYMD